MPVESVTYLDDLVATNPAQSDQLAEGDNHIRNIKLALLNTFPDVAGATNVTDTQLTDLGEKSYAPGDIKMQAHATWDADHWHECDGALATVAADAALYAVLGTTWNTSGETPGVTFRLPTMAQRYPRGRGTSAVGVYLDGLVLAHTHTASTTHSIGSLAAGTTFSFTVGSYNHEHYHNLAGTGFAASHSHTGSIGFSPAALSNGGIGGAGSFIDGDSTSLSIDASGSLALSGRTATMAETGLHAGTHTHVISDKTATTTLTGITTATVTVDANVGTENRPASTTLVFLIKR